MNLQNFGKVHEVILTDYTPPKPGTLFYTVNKFEKFDPFKLFWVFYLFKSKRTIKNVCNMFNKLEKEWETSQELSVLIANIIEWN